MTPRVPAAHLELIQDEVKALQTKLREAEDKCMEVEAQRSQEVQLRMQAEQASMGGDADHIMVFQQGLVFCLPPSVWQMELI